MMKQQNKVFVRKYKEGQGRKTELHTTEIQLEVTTVQRAEHTETLENVFLPSLLLRHEFCLATNIHFRGQRRVAKCWLQSRCHHDQGQANFGLTVRVVHSTMVQLSAASSQMNLYGPKCESVVMQFSILYTERNSMTPSVDVKTNPLALLNVMITCMLNPYKEW